MYNQFKILLFCRVYTAQNVSGTSAHHQEPPPTAFAASGYRMIAGLDVLQAVVGLLVNRPQLEARPTRQSYGNQRLQRQLARAPDRGHTETC
jgi:hypothetical protein